MPLAKFRTDAFFLYTDFHYFCSHAKSVIQELRAQSLGLRISVSGFGGSCSNSNSSRHTTCHSRV